jgi:hypothetical protein
MEDVLAVYTRPHDPDIHLVCLDETSKQLIAETCSPIQMKEGRAARFDYGLCDALTRTMALRTCGQTR